jgi:hypothetical protein
VGSLVPRREPRLGLCARPRLAASDRGVDEAEDVEDREAGEPAEGADPRGRDEADGLAPGLQHAGASPCQALEIRVPAQVLREGLGTRAPAASLGEPIERLGQAREEAQREDRGGRGDPAPRGSTALEARGEGEARGEEHGAGLDAQRVEADQAPGNRGGEARPGEGAEARGARGGGLRPAHRERRERRERRDQEARVREDVAADEDRREREPARCGGSRPKPRDHAGAEPGREQQEPRALDQETPDVEQPRLPREAADLGVEGVRQRSAVVDEPEDRERREERRVGERPAQRAAERGRAAAAPRGGEVEAERHPGEQDSLGPRERRERDERRRSAAAPPRVRRERGRGEEREERRLHAEGRPVAEGGRDEDERRGHRRSELPLARETRCGVDRRRDEQAGRAGEPERVSDGRRIEPERDAARDEERPEQVREPLDALARVVDEPEPVDQVSRVAVGDVGVVELGTGPPGLAQELGDDRGDEERGKQAATRGAGVRRALGLPRRCHGRAG